MEDNIIAVLERTLKSAKMEEAELSYIWPGEHYGFLPYPTNEKEVTAWIKQRTQIYRETWLVQPINQVLQMLRGEKGE